MQRFSWLEVKVARLAALVAGRGPPVTAANLAGVVAVVQAPDVITSDAIGRIDTAAWPGRRRPRSREGHHHGSGYTKAKRKQSRSHTYSLVTTGTY